MTIDLSICIPTYNHIESLKYCLKSIIEARNGYEENVEIIISDNGSTDGTFEYVSKLDVVNLIYKKNISNLGFNKNLFLLVDNYAHGEYVWTIGDDDYISDKSIEFFLNNKSNSDILFLKYKAISEINLIQEQKKTRSFAANTTEYYTAIDEIADLGNLMATFMTCAIFKRAIFNEIDKKDMQENDWNTFSKVFPNGYLLALGFSESNNIKYSKDCFIFIVPHEKEWDDKMKTIEIKVLPELYNFLKNLNPKKTKRLSKTRYFLYYINLKNFLRGDFKTKLITFSNILNYDYIYNSIKLITKKLHIKEENK